MLALSHIAHDRDLAMIGSQAIHAITDDVLDDVLISRDCDVQFDPDDPPVAVSRNSSRRGRGSRSRALLADRSQAGAAGR